MVMQVDTSNYVVLGNHQPGSKDFYIQHRTDENGQPGKIQLMADGKGDLKEVAQGYIEKGFDPKKILINGQPASDVFSAQTKPSFKGGEQAPAKKIGGAGKAWASAFIPSLGQFLDGRNKDGATFLGASMGLSAKSTVKI